MRDYLAANGKESPEIEKVDLVLVPESEAVAPANWPKISINEEPLDLDGGYEGIGWIASADAGDAIPELIDGPGHKILITDSGDAVLEDGSDGAIDTSTIADILLVCEYKLPTTEN